LRDFLLAPDGCFCQESYPMKKLTDVFAPWGKFYTTFSDSLDGGGQDGNPQHNDQKHRKKMAIIAVIVIIASAGWLWHTMMPTPPKINQAPSNGLGEVLAEETLKAIDNHGTVVPVIADSHTTDIQWEAFKKEIKKHNTVTLADPVIVKPYNGMEKEGAFRACIDKVVEENAKADALVLFVGLPMVWDDNNLMTLPSVGPKIIAVDGNNSPSKAKKYFINSIVTVLIMSRRTADPNAMDNPQTPRQWFDREYQVFTKENYESLPD